MYNHEPQNYRCPFCRNIAVGESDGEFALEMLHRYDEVFVKMNPRWWPGNAGGALVIPIAHHENLYELPIELGNPIQQAVRDTALAMKSAFDCDGVSTRQHNEPAGGQDVWHFHVHVFPRYPSDLLYESQGQPADAGEMHRLASLLRGAWPS